MKKIIVLNHKSSLTLEKAKKYPLEINEYLRTDQTVIISPSSPYFPYFKGKYNFSLASQNISSENITGELTGKLLKSMEIKYVIIGTNDRKNITNEDEKVINKKIKEAVDNNIIPIITIGETYYEYQLNKTIKVITKQITNYLKKIEVKQDLIINYSPDWTYEGKQLPNSDYLSEVIELIKNIVKKAYNTKIKVIYGGKITKDNIKEIDKIKTIDGYLITEKSTNIKEVLQILNTIE